MTEFFRLADDLDLRGRWYLGSPILQSGDPVDPRVFLRARPTETALPLRLSVRRPGRPIDFTLADFDMPVASGRLAERVGRLAPGMVQRIPVTVEGQEGNYEILNLLSEVRCLNEQATAISWWAPEDGRPDKVGQYRMVSNEVIDPTQVHGEHLFRLGGWRIEIICSREFKCALETASFSGLAFHPISVAPA